MDRGTAVDLFTRLEQVRRTKSFCECGHEEDRHARVIDEIGRVTAGVGHDSEIALSAQVLAGHRGECQDDECDCKLFAAWELPVYNVRLDAQSDRDDERYYRVRVTDGPGEPSARDFVAVFLIAAEVKADVSLQNGGVELT